MRHLPVLRLPALVRGWPGRSRSRPRSRSKVRAAIAVAALFALALVGLNAAGSRPAPPPGPPTAAPRRRCPAPCSGRELRHRRPGRRLQRHLGQRHRQQLPLRRGGPGEPPPTPAAAPPTTWAGPGRPVVQLHRQRRHGRHLHRRPAGGRAHAVTDALHIDNSAGTNLSGNVNIPATGGYQDLDHRQRHRHPARRPPDPDRGPGQRRLEHPLPRLRPEQLGRRRGGGTGGGRPLRRTAAAVPGNVLAELRHRRPGRGLQRHLGQRERQRLPVRRGGPGGHHRHRRRRQRPGLDRGRPVVQVHRQRRDSRHLHGRPAAGRAEPRSPTPCTSTTAPAPT